MSYKSKNGFSLIEVMMAVAIIATLASVFLVISKKIEDNAKIKLAQSTIKIVETALELYADSGYQLHDWDIVTGNVNPEFKRYHFPPDCRNYPATGNWQESNPKYFNIVNVLRDVLQVSKTPNLNIAVTAVFTANNQYCYGSLVMTELLNRVPASREMLAAIVSSQKTNLDENGKKIVIEYDNVPQETFLVVDPWGKPLRYWYKNELQAFPVVESAGPDGEFDTADDISN